MFQSGCKIGQLNEHIMSVGTCSSLAMVHILGHAAGIEEEPVRTQFGDALQKWSRSRATIKQNVSVAGKIRPHSFDFVAYPKDPNVSTPIAISVLTPTAGSLSAAERFGFKAKDLEGTLFSAWKKLVVEARSEAWSKEADNIIRQCSNAVIEIESYRTITEHEVAESLQKLIAA
jgi:hypothetical protein